MTKIDVLRTVLLVEVPTNKVGKRRSVGRHFATWIDDKRELRGVSGGKWRLIYW